MLLAVVFLSATAQAYETEANNVAVMGNEDCVSCEKCSSASVPLPETGQFCPFDYDDTDPESQFNKDDYGYCPNSGDGEYDTAGKPLSRRKCHFIMNVCSCPDAYYKEYELDEGTLIGIQMTILTEGVYWAEDPKAYEDRNGGGERTIWFNNYPSRQAACDAPADDLIKNFGPVRYYQTPRETINSKAMLLREPIIEVTQMVGCSDGPVPALNKSQVIEWKEKDYHYVTGAEDAENCWFRIDIPAMRLDNTAQRGDAIRIRASLIWPPKYNPMYFSGYQCECIRTVGYVSCESDKLNRGCLFFPYLVHGEEDMGGWVSGVGISTSGDYLPSDAWLELILRDSEGGRAVWKNTDMGDKFIWAFILDRVMENFSKTLAPGPVSLKVRGNFPMGGYGFLMNQQWQLGAGQMPLMCEE